mmetsp:Transcript_20733/g.37475  ORF Transcript_20733/g.37475 Transcript_20733/m.37475 type:complete len:93 (-) Transcript_20733:112-390(-)
MTTNVWPKHTDGISNRIVIIRAHLFPKKKSVWKFLSLSPVALLTVLTATSVSPERMDGIQKKTVPKIITHDFYNWTIKHHGIHTCTTTNETT